MCTFGISPQQLGARLDKVPVEPPSLGPGTLWDVCSGGRVVIGAIDYLDRLKGVAPKLLAWEALLRDYPHYRKGHVLVQVCVGARNRIQIKTAPAVESELRRIVERINANHERLAAKVQKKMVAEGDYYANRYGFEEGRGGAS